MKKVSRGILLLVLVLAVFSLSGCVASFLVMSMMPSVPENYTSTVRTGGPVESKYLAYGPYETAKMTIKTGGAMEKMYIYYPKEMGETEFPLVLFANGTGVKAKKYPALFKHLASWGYIVVGNDDPGTWNGKSIDECLEYILEEDENPESIFYHHVDEENIGITGHSQGGVAVFNAITNTPHASLYKAAVSLSPTHLELAENLKWHYEPEKVSCPILILAGTGDVDAGTIIPLEKMKELFDLVPSHKVMARRSGVDHGEVLYSADGYVTAWLEWILKGNEEAGAAFVGAEAELLSNGLYQNQKVSLGEDL